MASDKAISGFITALRVHFTTWEFAARANESEVEAETRRDREKAWMTSIMKTLLPYSDEVVATAAGKIVATRKDRKFPLPVEINKALADAAGDAKRQALQIPAASNRLDQERVSRLALWDEDRIKLAKILIKGEMGREASYGGWVNALYEFARNNARLPNEYEIAKVKQACDDLEWAYAASVAGGFEQAKTFQTMMEKTFRKREELKAFVLGTAD